MEQELTMIMDDTVEFTLSPDKAHSWNLLQCDEETGKTLVLCTNNDIVCMFME